jgi:hypothetical protein
MMRNINDSVSGLLAAFAVTFPHFRNAGLWTAVKNGGNPEAEKVFLVLNAFSTNFPQNTVDAERLVS